VEVVASLSQGRTAAAQCGLFTYKSVPVIFEPPCKILCVIMFMEAIPLCLVLNTLVNLLSRSQNRFSLIQIVLLHVRPTGGIILTIDGKPYVSTI